MATAPQPDPALVELVRALARAAAARDIAAIRHGRPSAIAVAPPAPR